MRSVRAPGLVALLVAVVLSAGGAGAQAPTVKIGYIPSDSFAALYIMADRYLTPAGITVQMVRLPGGAEITSQVATGQLQVGGSGMGAAGFNAVAARLPLEFIAPLPPGGGSPSQPVPSSPRASRKGRRNGPSGSSEPRTYHSSTS